MTQQEVVDLVSSSDSGEEWDNNCDKVKDAHGGQYPNYWYNLIILSGLMSEVAERWDE